jgi:hypothetical protein
LVLAWHHDHLGHQSHGKKKHHHQQECQHGLDFAEGLLDDQFERLKGLVFEKLGAVVKASSLVEMVNSLIRPYLNSCKGQITQETLNLIMFYHNHRRYRSGRRKGKAPIELLTGEALQDDWVKLLIQHKQKASQDATGDSSPALESVTASQDATGDSSPALESVTGRHGQTAQSEMLPEQTIFESRADADPPWQPTDVEAA